MAYYSKVERGGLGAVGDPGLGASAFQPNLGASAFQPNLGFTVPGSTPPIVAPPDSGFCDQNSPNFDPLACGVGITKNVICDPYSPLYDPSACYGVPVTPPLPPPITEPTYTLPVEVFSRNVYVGLAIAAVLGVLLISGKKRG